jgi:uncharacterized protein
MFFDHGSTRQGLKALLLVATLAGSIGLAAATEERLVIETASGSHSYNVELALTPEERSLGLMNRESMDDDHGMLFRFDSIRPVTMWMKNTLIPLDMIFIRRDGTVAGFHENAEPLSEAVIASPEPVLYVLELNGGKASEIELSEGDRVLHPVISESR